MPETMIGTLFFECTINLFGSHFYYHFLEVWKLSHPQITIFLMPITSEQKSLHLNLIHRTLKQMFLNTLQRQTSAVFLILGSMIFPSHYRWSFVTVSGLCSALNPWLLGLVSPWPLQPIFFCSRGTPHGIMAVHECVFKTLLSTIHWRFSYAPHEGSFSRNTFEESLK